MGNQTRKEYFSGEFILQDNEAGAKIANYLRGSPKVRKYYETGNDVIKAEIDGGVIRIIGRWLSLNGLDLNMARDIGRLAMEGVK
ncbi:MAG TPA: hypothetical protein VMC07_02965 [Candidatus Omnitrophota bacterium]|nr:hypothetical protein [Candidatus Omnitrophota bacterium]